MVASQFGHNCERVLELATNILLSRELSPCQATSLILERKSKTRDGDVLERPQVVTLLACSVSKQRLRDLKNYLQNLILQVVFEVRVRSVARVAREMTCNTRDGLCLYSRLL